jgi:putative Mn2+ efflux pump MntP
VPRPDLGADMARSEIQRPTTPPPERDRTAQTPTAPAKPEVAPTGWAKLAGWVTDPASGWDARLWRLWALYTALAYTVILAIIAAIASLGFDVTDVAITHRVIGTLLIATGGAALYGAVLGRLQWRVLRQRLPLPRRRWISACIIPALVVWGSVVVPAAISADTSGHNLRVAYLLAVSQALALGPLIGFAQARALKPYTQRWKWWIAANIVSYLLVYAVFYLISAVIGGFDFIEGEGTPLEAYVVLISTTPISGRWLLWVTAPGTGRRDAPAV